MNRQQFGSLLNLKEDLIPQGKRNRPSGSNVPKFITIHNTDNPTPGAGAKNHAKFLKNVGHYILEGKKYWVSWHYTVDDFYTVKHLPINEGALHAPGANIQSIGIEICMFQGIDQENAFLRAARLCAALLYDLSLLNRDIQKIKPHQFWTGKECPRLLLNDGRIGEKWNRFLQLVQQELDSIDVEEERVLEREDLEEESNSNLMISNVGHFSDFHIDTTDLIVKEGQEVSISAGIMVKLEKQAIQNGISVETLTNLLLNQRLEDMISGGN